MSKDVKLHEGLRQIVHTYGHEIYKNVKLINYLNDYCQFDPPALYFVMKTLIQDGYASKLLDTSNSRDWKLYVQQSIGKVQKQYGFSGIYVNYCFQSLAYGIGLYPVINKRLLDEVEGKVPEPVAVPQQQPVPKQTTIQKKPHTTPTKKPKPVSTQSPQPQGIPWGTPNNGNVWGGNVGGSTRQTNWPGTQVQQPGNKPGSSSTNPLPSNKGCTGCMDDVSSIFSVIIFILWLLIECS